MVLWHIQLNPLRWIAMGPDNKYPLMWSIHLSKSSVKVHHHAKAYNTFYILHAVCVEEICNILLFLQNA